MAPLVRRLLAGCLACLAWGATSGLSASTSQDIGEKQADLSEVKVRLKQLQKEISDSESDRSAAADALAAVERTFSAATRKARELSQEREQVEQDLQHLDAEQRALEARIATRQQALGAWLRHYYTHNQGERMARLFDTGDPNQLARNAYYVELAGTAHRQLVEGLRADLLSKEKLVEDARGQHEQLAELEAAQRQESETLERLQMERKVALAAVSSQLDSQRHAAAALQRDEERLAQLIAGLQRIAREQAAKAAAEAEARRRAAEEAARHSSANAASRAASPAHTREDTREGPRENAAVPQPAAVSGGGLAKQQGRLPAPLHGELEGRFGTARSGGGTAWKGIFIRAAAGAEVRAVAPGEVVFADWLRGFGNLLVVDHGDNFLTIYGNNDTLLRTNGERVAGGEVVARVGSSGGGGEPGLYFEIRRQGQALDPLKWIRWP